MDKQVKIARTNSGEICLYSDNNDWREGNAYNTEKKEIIYYNGDYGDSRPIQIKKLVARPEEIGWVRFGGGYLTSLVNISEIKLYLEERIGTHQDDCLLCENKIDGKYVINLQL